MLFLDEMNGNKLQDALITAASKHPDRVAVIFDRCSGPGSCVSLTYKDVVCYGNHLCSSLRELCRENNGLIGLYVQNDVYLPGWIFGILQLPAAYVPLNPDVPGILSARIMTMCHLKYCTVQSSLFEQFQKKFSKLLTVEVCKVWVDFNLTLVRVQLLSTAAIVDLGQPASTNLAEKTPREDFAYVLHTSGTTGPPKIVRVPHKCIVPNIQNLRSLFQMNAEDLVFLASPLTFDPSVVDIFLAMSSGARLLIAPSVIKKAPNRLAKLLFKDHKTTVLQVTPSLLGRLGRRTLREEVLCAGSSLRVLALGGEACPSPGLLQSWRQESNTTQIFNVYGITEVSCWACCYPVPESLLKSSQQAQSSIPIGAPLLNTSVEVRDDQGCVITEGQGQVFIGGEERVCLIDDECTLVPGTMRATGDWVRMEGTSLYYLGRKDRLVKRLGQRVNLDAVQQVIMGLSQVESCAVGLLDNGPMIAFVMAAPPVHKTVTSMEMSLLIPEDHEEDRGSTADLPEERVRAEAPDRVLQRVVLQQLSLLVPSASIPDSLVLVEGLPLTAHGKVDMSALLKLYQRQRECLVNSFKNTAQLKKRLIGLWQDSLGHSEGAAVEDYSHFLFSGGDSLKALRLHDDIMATIGHSVPGLLEAILEGSFTEVVSHVAGVMQLVPEADSPNAPVAWKRSADHPAASTLSKRERIAPETSLAPDYSHGSEGSTERRLIKVLRRAGQVLEMNMGNQNGSHCKTLSANIKTDSSAPGTSRSGIHRVSGPLEPEPRSTEPRSPEMDPRPPEPRPPEPRPQEPRSPEPRSPEPRSPEPRPQEPRSPEPRPQEPRPQEPRPPEPRSPEPRSPEPRSQEPEPRSPELRVRWSSDTGRCVDASPLLVVVKSRGDGGAGSTWIESTTVFIGSHSHRLQALDLTTGGLLWERVLGDRIESSAVMTRCGAQLAVGCYDGGVYLLCVATGATRWVFQTEDAVKSSPALDPATGLVIVGSHDGYVYALDPQARRCAWKHHCGGGAVFSSPYLDPSQRRLYAATLRGLLVCLHPDSGEVLWTYARETPFFSSPCGSPGRVVIGSVDGHICSFSDTGQSLWQFLAKGAVFSTPCFTPDGRRVLCGAHDGCVYCLDAADGRLVWSFQTSGRVYASPWAFKTTSTAGSNRTLVCVASTDGVVWILDGLDGRKITSLSLPGELFSSPVVWERSVVVGCRNDRVYCMELRALIGRVEGEGLIRLESLPRTADA